MKDYRFPPCSKIKSSEDFAKVIQQGQVAVGAILVVNAQANQRELLRLGVTIPKKTGNSPMRNRWKRLIREVFRLHRQDLPIGWDLVVRPRKGAAPDFHALNDELPRLVWQVTGRRSGQRAP